MYAEGRRRLPRLLDAVVWTQFFLVCEPTAYGLSFVPTSRAENLELAFFEPILRRSPV
jgi:hypothetical protein